MLSPRWYGSELGRNFKLFLFFRRIPPDVPDLIPLPLYSFAIARLITLGLEAVAALLLQPAPLRGAGLVTSRGQSLRVAGTARGEPVRVRRRDGLKANVIQHGQPASVAGAATT